jgi:two-component system response regulator
MPDPTAPPRLFLVEDDPADAELTRRVLASIGLDGNLIVLRDGKEAVDQLHAILEGRVSGGLPELILLDLRLPKMSGMQVLQWIRADRRSESIPVLVLTGARDDTQVMALQKLGIVGFLEKPLTAAAFRRAINSLRTFSMPVVK